jgi:hypothetical protein
MAIGLLVQRTMCASLFVMLSACGGGSSGSTDPAAATAADATAAQSALPDVLLARKVRNAPAPAPSPAPTPTTTTNGASVVGPEFFGMHLAAQIADGWPTVKFGIQRTWDSWPGVSWSDLNPSPGVYNWTNLDALVNDSMAHGVDLVYTFGHVPAWASSNPSGTCDGNPAGDCYAPAAAAWKTFVTQISARYQGKIKYWELWNEPNASNFWKGSNAELVSMAAAAYPVIKAAGGTVLSPTPQGTSGYSWLDGYFAAGGATYLDVVSFHGYLYGPPEYLNALVTNLRTVQAKYGLSAKQLWDTEHSWGDSTWPMGADQDQQSAWLARDIVLAFSDGLDRSFWYGWEHFNWGTLYDRTTKQILKPGIAYGQLYGWMLGASMSSCTQANGLYQCKLARANGYQGQIVWSTGANVSYAVPAGFTRMRTIDATTAALTGGQSISIGMKPVLVETGAP